MKANKREVQFEKTLSVLGQYFDQLFINDPKFAKKLPANCYVLFQLEIDGDLPKSLFKDIQDFNHWVWEVCQPQIESNQDIVVITHKLLFEARSHKRHTLLKLLKEEEPDVALQKVYA